VRFGYKVIRCRQVQMGWIATIPKSKLGHRIGHLNAADLIRLNQALLIFLGLAG
jgi:hypothetical protein